MKRFWDIEQEPTIHLTPVIRLEEQLALQTAESSIKYEHQMYRVERQPVLQDRHGPTKTRRRGLYDHRTLQTRTVSALNSMLKKCMSGRYQSRRNVNQSGTCRIFRSSDLTKKRPKRGWYLMLPLSMKMSP